MRDRKFLYPLWKRMQSDQYFSSWLIPRFREQIEHGGPVTVTHPEITRFFMTIPEACRLVMEAATISAGNEICVFDMGEPVKIAHLAEMMIRLCDLEVGKDIRIEYTGLRPEEKLYEEVLADTENTLPTSHDKIRITKVREYGYGDAKRAVGELETLARQVRIPELLALKKRLVPEYRPEISCKREQNVSLLTAMPSAADVAQNQNSR